MKKKIEWFKNEIVPLMSGYTIEYNSYENGDFGHLYRIEFEGNSKGGNVDFWEKEWVEIHLYDYQNDQVIMHSLLEPSEAKKLDSELLKLKSILIDE